MGLAAALLTAFYMTRLMLYTFHGPNRTGEREQEHLQEAPSVMTGPLVVLGALTVLGGALNVPELFGGSAFLEHWLEPVTSVARRRLAGEPAADGRGGGVRGLVRDRRPGRGRSGGALAHVPPVGAHRAARLARARRARRGTRSGALGQAPRARSQPRRVRNLGAVVVDVRAGGRHAVHPRRAVDPELGD